MTIKEIALTAGCSEKTVKRFIAEKFPSKMVHGKVTRLTWQEAHDLMEVLPKKNMVSNLGQMSSVQGTNVISTNTDSSIMLAKIAEAMSAIALAVQNQGERIQSIETKIETKQLLLPPSIKPRDHISKLVREFAHKSKIDYQDAWRNLYREFGYRYNCNASLSAKNRGMAIIDYIESEGLLDELLAVANEVCR